MVEVVRGGLVGLIELRQLVVPEQVDLALAQLGRVLNGEDLAPFEIDVMTKHGRRITLELGARPIQEHGTIVAAQAIARGVTTRKELEAQLRQAQKMEGIGQLAAGVAHDFNNLLTVILGNCEDSARLLEPGSLLQGPLADIRLAAERAASLTSQLLAFSLRQIVQPQVLNLNDVIFDVQRMMTRLIGEDVELQFHPHPDIGSISADVGQLHQIVVNLAVNARDAMPNGGRLTLETRHVRLEREYAQTHPQVPPGDYVMLAVSDTGMGMDETIRARLFEPFFTTKAVGEGTGLGLATVYGIVKQHGGFIWVYSEPGLGSTFKIYFPSVEADPVSPADEPVHDSAAAGHEVVLLVEDEEAVRELLSRYLVRRGYVVLTAPNGEEAVAICREGHVKPSLLISDIVMPGISGPALAEELRGIHSEIKMLFISGYPDAAVRRHGMLSSGTHFLQKPFSLNVIAGKIREILDENAR